MTTVAAKTDVDALIDEGGFGRYQIFIIALCSGLMFLDGLDANIVAFLAPTLAKLWKLGPHDLGFIFTVGVVSSALASLVNGPIADRSGRRRWTILYTAIFGVVTLASAFAQSGNQFALARFVAGIGLGGALPNAVALGVEFAPARRRGFTAIVLFSVFGFGQSFGGVLTAALLRTLGWRVLVGLSGVVPLLLLILMTRSLPESIRFLAQQRENSGKVIQVLQRIRPGWKPAPGTSFAGGGVPEKARVRALFEDGRAVTTIALLIMAGLNNTEIAFLTFWLPSVIASSGGSIQVAALVTTTMVLTGIVGIILLGRVTDRVGHYPMLLGTNILAVCSLAIFGGTMGNLIAMLLIAGAIGIGVNGFQSVVNSLAASFYPTSIRTTGCGWVIAAGRVVGIAGPFVGGLLVGAKVPPTSIFLINAVLVGMSSICLLSTWRSRPRPSTSPSVA